MSTITVTGNLAADPEIVQAGSLQITKLRVFENTGEYRKGTWHPHPVATVHYVEAKFSLGQNAAASLHKGDPVIVIGRERTDSWGEGDNAKSRRVLLADTIGADLGHATATITRTSRQASAEDAAGENEPF